jgi:adenylate cyclase class 2
MPVEVELKVWVDDPVSLEALLYDKFQYEEEYDKKDSYYIFPDGPAGNRISLRLRKEEHQVTVTLKEKSVMDGIETNKEDEFTVSSFAGMRLLLETLGCLCYIEKRKKGKKFRTGDCTLELSKVEKLGWFLEIEKLVPPDDPDAVKQAKEEIRRLLTEVGIGEDKIEPRYYTEMLQAKS